MTDIMKKKEIVKAKTSEKIAKDMISKRKTFDLIRDFVLTNLLTDPCSSIVRGWIMDELEKRNKVAFDAWLSQDSPEDQQLEKFYMFSTRGNTADGSVSIWYGQEFWKKVPDLETAISEIARVATSE